MGTKALIKYSHNGNWSGYKLTERLDGTWRYEQNCKGQGCVTGGVTIIKPPDWWHVNDEADMDSLAYNPTSTKADMLIYHGEQIRCLRHGHIVQ